jgi:hypothetical protein
MTRLDDIRKYITFINCAISTALLAAILSITELGEHGSHANGNFLNAAHWILVVMLAAAAVGCRWTRSYAEPTWLLYGILFGEVDMEGPLSSALVFISALSFFLYRKIQHPSQATPGAVCSTPPEENPVL